MMFLRLAIWGLLILGPVLGCGKFWDDETEPTPQAKRSKQRLSEVQEILSEELITGETFVAKVKEGDRLTFRIKGWREKSQFSTYTKTAMATWTQQECPKDFWKDNTPNPGWTPKNRWDEPPVFDLAYHKFLDQCPWVEKSAPCQLRYREKKQSLKELLYPEGSFLAYPLRIVLGGKFHPLRIMAMGHEFFEGELVITKEMLDALGDSEGDLSLDVTNSVPSTLDVGFLWFESCPGRYSASFQVDSHLQTWSEDNFTRNQFQVSVTLETTL